MRFAYGLLITLFALAVTGLSPAQAAVVPFNQNLIINGDAESDIGSATRNDIVSVTGFSNVVGNFTVVRYGVPEFPSTTSPGPINRGLNFFSGGPNISVSSANQIISVSSIDSSIDSGTTRYHLSGFLGGYTHGQNDNAVLTATFLNSQNTSLGIGSIGPVLNTERNDITGLLERSTDDIVPIGTRSIEMALLMTKTDGGYNDGYADNLSLILNPVPLPAAVWLFAPAVLGLGTLARRRRS